MRILVASPFLPHAAVSHGGGVYLHALLRAMAQQIDLTVVCFATRSELACGAVESAGSEFARLHVVVRPTRAELTGLRSFRERLRLLRRWGVGRAPLVVAKFDAAAMRRVIGDVVRTSVPDVAMAEFSLMAQYLPELGARGAVPTVLTDHEACSPVPAAILPGGLGIRRDRQLWETYFDESYPRADLLQALNETDAETLRIRFGRPVEVRPAVVDLPATPVDPAVAPARALFLGDYSHHPNPEAAKFLVREVWPAVRRAVGAAELWLAGPNMGTDVLALAAEPGVVIRGFAPVLGELFAACRVVVAPLLSGRGSRIKVLSALSHGVPVVGNALGLRGVGASEPAVFVRESSSELAERIGACLLAPDLARRAGLAARRWAEENVSAEAVARLQIRRLTALSTSGENSPRRG